MKQNTSFPKTKDLKHKLIYGTDSSYKQERDWVLSIWLLSYSFIVVWLTIFFFRHSLWYKQMPKEIGDYTLIWMYVTAVLSIGHSLWKFFAALLRQKRKGWPDWLDEKIALENGLAAFLKAYSKKHLSELEERLIIELEMSKYQSDWMTIAAAVLSASLAAIFGIKEKSGAKFDATSLLHPSLFVYVFLFILISLGVTLFSSLALTRNRHTIHRIAWAAHKAATSEVPIHHYFQVNVVRKHSKKFN